MIEPRYTTHSYAGYWWIKDNLTGLSVKDAAGRLVTFHVQATWQAESTSRGGYERARRKAAHLNAKEEKTR